MMRHSLLKLSFVIVQSLAVVFASLPALAADAPKYTPTGETISAAAAPAMAAPTSAPPLAASAAANDKIEVNASPSSMAEYEQLLKNSGEFEEFHALLDKLAYIYEDESPHQLAVFNQAFSTSMIAKLDFDTAVAAAKKLATSKPTGSTPDDQLDEAEHTVKGPLASALADVINNLFSGTISDFNYKITVLAGSYIFDPEARPLVYMIFDVLNQNVFTPAYFDRLRYNNDYREVALQGAYYGAWVGIALTGFAGLARVKNIGKLIKQPFATLKNNWRDARAADREANAALRARPNTATVAETQANSVEPVVEPEVDPEIAAARAKIKSNIEKLERVEQNFHHIFGDARDRHDAKLFQEAQAGNLQAKKRLSMRFFTAQQLKNMSSNAVRRSKEKYYAQFLGISLSSQVNAMVKVLGLWGGAGAVSNSILHYALYVNDKNVMTSYTGHVPGRNANIWGIGWGIRQSARGLQNLMNYIESKSVQRVVPLDHAGHPDLMSRGYEAMAALRLSCNVDLLKNVEGLLYNEVQNAPANYNWSEASDTWSSEAEALSGFVSEYAFMSDSSVYTTQQNAPKEINYNTATQHIVMNIPFGRTAVHEEFECAKFAKGIRDNQLQISLLEDHMLLKKTYNEMAEIYPKIEAKQPPSGSEPGPGPGPAPGPGSAQDRPSANDRSDVDDSKYDTTPAPAAVLKAPPKK